MSKKGLVLSEDMLRAVAEGRKEGKTWLQIAESVWVKWSRLYHACKDLPAANGVMEPFMSVQPQLPIQSEPEFVQIPGLPDWYRVSRKGVVLSPKGKVVSIYKQNKKDKNSHSVFYVQLGKNKQSTYPVHRSMALAFLPNPKNLAFAYFINGNPEDIRLDNIWWTDSARKDAMKIRGEWHVASKPVLQFSADWNFINRYGNAYEAERALWVASNGISKVAWKRRRGTAGGYIWVFEKDCPDRKLPDEYKIPKYKRLTDNELLGIKNQLVGATLQEVTKIARENEFYWDPRAFNRNIFRNASYRNVDPTLKWKLSTHKRRREELLRVANLEEELKKHGSQRTLALHYGVSRPFLAKVLSEKNIDSVELTWKSKIRKYLSVTNEQALKICERIRNNEPISAVSAEFGFSAQESFIVALAKILGNKLPIACGKDFSLGRSSYFYMDVAKRIQYGETTMPKEAEANGIRYTKFKIALLSSLPAWTVLKVKKENQKNVPKMPPKAIESYDIDSRNSLLLAVYNYAGKVYYNNLKVKHLFSERGTPKIDGIINLATKVNPGNEQALIEELERYSSRNKSVVEWEENFVFFDERCTPIGTAALGRNKLNLMLWITKRAFVKAEKPAEKSAPTTEAAETKEVLSSEEGITKTVPETPDIDTARETTEVVKVRAKRGTYAVIMRAVRTKKNATAIMRRINRRESTWETEAKAFGVQGHNLRSAVVRMLGAEFRPTYAQNQPYEEEQGKKWSWPVIVGISLILTIAIADVMTLFHIPPFR